MHDGMVRGLMKVATVSVVERERRETRSRREKVGVVAAIVNYVSSVI